VLRIDVDVDFHFAGRVKGRPAEMNRTAFEALAVEGVPKAMAKPLKRTPRQRVSFDRRPVFALARKHARKQALQDQKRPERKQRKPQEEDRGERRRDRSAQ